MSIMVSGFGTQKEMSQTKKKKRKNNVYCKRRERMMFEIEIKKSVYVLVITSSKL